MSPPLLHDECATHKFHPLQTGQQRKNAFVRRYPSTSAQTHLYARQAKKGPSDGSVLRAFLDSFSQGVWLKGVQTVESCDEGVVGTWVVV
jgi:hypothetical protein